jgi:hypothetical protein
MRDHADRIERGTRRTMLWTCALARRQRLGIAAGRTTAGAVLLRNALALGRAVKDFPVWAARVLVTVNVPADAWTCGRV